MRSFQPADKQREVLRLATMVDGTPTLIEVSQDEEGDGGLVASSVPDADAEKVSSIAEWVLFAELNLAPFYGAVAASPKLKDLTERLRGLKPMRPVSLFEMAVIAITEQQISLAAAYRIRSRLVERFGVAVEEEWVFPEPQALASATLEDLRSCGLSRQKASYIRDLAVDVAGGTLDLNTLKSMDDDSAREMIMGWRGFGRWSADYILVRGLARPDCVPIDDLGVRSVIGEYLGNGERASVAEATEILEPFRPYRGLLAFYLLADYRLARTSG
jgi:DNA-3-methyladenine glycosylase II